LALIKRNNQRRSSANNRPKNCADKQRERDIKAEARRKAEETEDFARMILNLAPDLPDKNKKGLQNMGYDLDEYGAPTVKSMIMLKLARDGMAGDLNAINTLFDYAHIPNMKAHLEMQRLKLEEKKVTGGNAGPNLQKNMKSIADLINNPTDDVTIDQLMEQAEKEANEMRAKNAAKENEGAGE
jgi:hypothetical protein